MSEESMTSRQNRAMELNAEYFGVSRLQLMENAGQCVAAEIVSRFKPQQSRVAVFCGLGGNGGDGFVAARHLVCNGFEVDVIIAGRVAEIADAEAKRNWHSLASLKHGMNFFEAYDSTLIPSVEANVIVDALLGVGLKGSLRPPVLQMVKRINKMQGFKIAVDVPTGIDSDSGDVLGDAVKANLTVTFHKTKLGLLKARDYTGDLIVARIGIPLEFEHLAGPGDVSLVIKRRLPDSHKGEFGRLLVIGGSDVFSGAPTLVALAALRTGVDLAYVATMQKIAYAISSISPDLITIKLPGEYLNARDLAAIKPYLDISTAIVLGPGLGLQAETKKTVKALVDLIERAHIPLLLDADSLKAFADFKRKLECPLVLTPHAGEYQMLVGRLPPRDLIERTEEVKKIAEELNAVVLLKGHVDIISDGKRTKMNYTGNPGMTVGGTGDVVSGIVGAFLAQQANPFEAAVAGAFVNGAAGDFVKGEKGCHMVASDLLDWIPRVMNDPMSHVKVRERAP